MTVLLAQVPCVMHAWTITSTAEKCRGRLDVSRFLESLRVCDALPSTRPFADCIRAGLALVLGFCRHRLTTLSLVDSLCVVCVMQRDN